MRKTSLVGLVRRGIFMNRTVEHYENPGLACALPAALGIRSWPSHTIARSANGGVCQRKASPKGVFLETGWQGAFPRCVVQPRFGRCRP
jgi:hypothetical protein